MPYEGCQGSPEPQSALDSRRESSEILKALAAGSSPQYPCQEGLRRRQGVPAPGLLPAPTAHAPASVAEELLKRSRSFFGLVAFSFSLFEISTESAEFTPRTRQQGNERVPCLCARPAVPQPQELPEPARTSPRMDVLHALVAHGNSGHAANDVLPK